MTEEVGEKQRQDDEAWFDILAGRPRADANPRTRREAEALRQAVLTEFQQAPQLLDADLAGGREKLLFRLKQEGLLQRPTRSWWRQPYILALAATLAGIALLLPVLKHQDFSTEPGSELPEIRKDIRMPEVVYTDRPAVAAQKLADSLKALGLKTTPVLEESSWFIDVQIPDPPPQGLEPLLRQHGLSVPTDRHLLVEFLPKE